MVECVENYFQDERLQMAYLGQGVIGTNASPHDRGTASIHFHHQSGRLGGSPGMWGYVKGGMGMVSFILCDIARDLGAVVATRRARGPDHSRRGVELEGGERIEARHVISNADPRATSEAAGRARPIPRGKRRSRQIPQVGCTVKLNVVLKELPSFKARPGTFSDHHQGQINTPLTKDEWADLVPGRRRPESSPPGSGPSSISRRVHDPSVAPPGVHTMSVFAQYVPHTFARGTGTPAATRSRTLALDSIGRFCDNIPDAVRDVQVLGPPDIEQKVGLTGGHIFQGECLPPYMWDKPALAPHPDARRFPLRRVHPPRRQRDRGQRTQRGDGGAG